MVLLIGILPGTKKGRYILSYPDKKTYQQKRCDDIHLIQLFIYIKSNIRAPEEDKQRCDDIPTQIDKIVMHKEIEIDNCSYTESNVFGRPVVKTEVEAPPCLANIAGDTCVHKAAI